MAAFLKRRIDPADLYNVTIRPVGETRFEIILPTGGAHQARIEETDLGRPDRRRQETSRTGRRRPRRRRTWTRFRVGRVRDLVSRVRQALNWAALKEKAPREVPGGEG